MSSLVMLCEGAFKRKGGEEVLRWRRWVERVQLQRPKGLPPTYSPNPARPRRWVNASAAWNCPNLTPKFLICVFFLSINALNNERYYNWVFSNEKYHVIFLYCYFCNVLFNFIDGTKHLNFLVLWLVNQIYYSSMMRCWIQ